MVARKAFHDLGFKMGDGVFAFWRFAHRTEPVVVYSVVLGFLGTFAPLQPQLPWRRWWSQTFAPHPA